jgi:hypothetical protein
MRGYKHCTSRYHEGPTWLPVSYFYVHQRKEDGSVHRLQSACITCQRLSGRVTSGNRKRGRPYRAKQLSRTGYKRSTPEEQKIYNEYQRRRYHNMTPEQREARRERERFRAEKRRREAGVKPRQFKNRKTVVKNLNSQKNTGEELMESKPLMDWLQREGLYRSEIAGVRLANVNGTIHLDQVDRVLVALDCPYILHELYPLS